MINKVTDEINTEKYAGENLFIRMIECKSEISEFATNSVPEIKSNLDIKPFAFEPNQKQCVFTNLGIIRLGIGTTELQIYQRERQSDVTCIEGASNVASSNLLEHEAKVDGAGDTSKSTEDPVRAELEKELEQLRKTTSAEKKEKEMLHQSYDTLRQELVCTESLLSREREKYVLEMKEHEQRTVLLQQEVTSLNDLNTSLKSQLDSRNKEFVMLESTYKAREEQDQSKIISLQSELAKISQDLQSQRESAEKTYQKPDPRAAGFDAGKRVKHVGSGRTGTVTSFDPSGYVEVKWDDGESNRIKAGAGGMYWVKLL